MERVNELFRSRQQENTRGGNGSWMMLVVKSGEGRRGIPLFLCPCIVPPFFHYVITLIIRNIYYITHYIILPVQTSCAIVIVQLCNQLMKIFGSKRPGMLLLLSATKKFINSFHSSFVIEQLTCDAYRANG